MKPAGGGYTIVELIIVLSVSGVILLSALTVFSGKQNTAQFNQAVQDLASKIQSYSTEVTSGVTPDISDSNCNIGGDGYPQFNSGSGLLSDECIYVGRALLVNTNSNSISAYAVVGARNNSGNLSETFDQAHITTATQGSNDRFRDDFDLSGLQILSSTITTDHIVPNNFGLIGVYSDLGGTSSPDTSNSTGLLTKAYQFNETDPGFGGISADVKKCVQGGPDAHDGFGDCTAPINNFSGWNLCVQYAGGPKAQINIMPTASSFNTQVSVMDCS